MIEIRITSWQRVYPSLTHDFKGFNHPFGDAGFRNHPRRISTSWLAKSYSIEVPLPKGDVAGVDEVPHGISEHTWRRRSDGIYWGGFPMGGSPKSQDFPSNCIQFLGKSMYGKPQLKHEIWWFNLEVTYPWKRMNIFLELSISHAPAS